MNSQAGKKTTEQRVVGGESSESSTPDHEELRRKRRKPSKGSPPDSAIENAAVGCQPTDQLSANTTFAGDDDEEDKKVAATATQPTNPTETEHHNFGNAAAQLDIFTRNNSNQQNLHFPSGIATLTSQDSLQQPPPPQVQFESLNPSISLSLPPPQVPPPPPPPPPINAALLPLLLDQVRQRTQQRKQQQQPAVPPRVPVPQQLTFNNLGTDVVNRATQQQRQALMAQLLATISATPANAHPPPLQPHQQAATPPGAVDNILLQVLRQQQQQQFLAQQHNETQQRQRQATTLANAILRIALESNTAPANTPLTLSNPIQQQAQLPRFQMNTINATSLGNPVQPPLSQQSRLQTDTTTTSALGNPLQLQLAQQAVLQQRRQQYAGVSQSPLPIVPLRQPQIQQEQLMQPAQQQREHASQHNASVNLQQQQPLEIDSDTIRARIPAVSVIDAIQMPTVVASTGRHGEYIIPVAMSIDAGHLSSYQVMLRKQLEFFTASDIDVAYSVQGRSKNVELHRLGIRCAHCSNSNTELRNRGRGAVYYPPTISAIYQAGQNCSINHLLKSCRTVPEGIRQKLGALRQKRQTTTHGKNYWRRACITSGIVEINGALWYQNPAAAAATAPSNTEEQTATSATVTASNRTTTTAATATTSPTTKDDSSTSQNSTRSNG